MAKTERMLLADIEDVHHIGNFSDLRQLRLLSFVIKQRFKFKSNVKMVFKSSFPATGDKEYLLNTGGNSLFNNILNKRLIYEREHLFRGCFSGRKKTGAKTGNRENGFFDVHLLTP